VSLTLALLGAYSLLLVLAGLWIGARVRGSGDFFVAGRRLGPGLVFVTLLAANIGAGSTVGATGLGYRYGLSAWWWSGSAALGCLLLGLVVAPRLHRLAAEHGLFTVGDFLEMRYDRSVRGIVAGILWLGTLSILAGQLIAMAWALQVVLGLSKTVGCIVGGLVLVAYFSGGGLLASVWVNLLELVVLLVGFLLAVPFAWRTSGGWTGLAAAGPAPGYASLTGMPADVLLGFLVTFVPSFMVSPGLVQKTFGARSAAAARGAVLANTAALALFAFIPPVLGMAARAARPALENAELALPTLMAQVLPPWLGGLALAALFAAEISTADAVLFMLSTSLSQDLYKTFLNPAADDRRLLAVGRGTSVVAGGLGIALAVLIPSVVDALKAFYGILTVSLLVPLVAGLFCRGSRAREARWGTLGAVAVTLSAQWWMRGRPSAAWLPYAIGIATAVAAFAAAAAWRARNVLLIRDTSR
jgi:solute:Na+ symporter, SSS family